MYASEYERLVEQGRIVRMKREAAAASRERPPWLAHLPSFTPIFDGDMGPYHSHIHF